MFNKILHHNYLKDIINWLISFKIRAIYSWSFRLCFTNSLVFLKTDL